MLYPTPFLNISLFIYLFIWLHWVLVAAHGLSVVVASGGHSSSWCTGLSLSRPLLLRGTGSRRAGSVVVAHGPSCSAACGILPDQGANLCPLHQQADSQPLRHQGSPLFLKFIFIYLFWPCCTACGILVPQPGIEPWPSAVRAQSSNHWTAREFPKGYFLYCEILTCERIVRPEQPMAVFSSTCQELV